MKRILRHMGKPLVASVALFFAPPLLAEQLDIAIEVAPNVLNIQSSGKVVTVHTDISYGSVNVYTVTLNGLPISSWKADDRGNFVAKFQMDEVKTLDGLALDDYNILTLYGVTWSEDAFYGKDEILVLNNVPSGRR